MADASSVTTFVVGDRLPWPEDSPAAVERGPFDAAIVHDSGSRHLCEIRKISSLGVTLKGQVAKVGGDEVSVELGTGQRVAATVAWVTPRELGLRFDEPVDLIALLNRKLVSQERERRTMPRLEVRCPVHIKCAANFWPATLRNISVRGLQVEGDELPATGTYAELFIEELIIPPGEVVWRRGRLAGVELFEELSWTSIIPWVRRMVKQDTH